MSPIALKLLSSAYEQYLKSGSKSCSYRYKSSDDMFYSTDAALQLYDDGFITDVSAFVFDDEVSIFSGPIRFTLTDKAIEYMRNNRKC